MLPTPATEAPAVVPLGCQPPHACADEGGASRRCQACRCHVLRSRRRWRFVPAHNNLLFARVQFFYATRAVQPGRHNRPVIARPQTQDCATQAKLIGPRCAESLWRAAHQSQIGRCTRAPCTMLRSVLFVQHGCCAEANPLLHPGCLSSLVACFVVKLPVDPSMSDRPATDAQNSRRAAVHPLIGKELG